MPGLFKKVLLNGLFGLILSPVLAQDSIVVKIHPAYGHANGIHRWLLGGNYREEWSKDVRLPVIRISEFRGGLTPERLGGGMQSKSLRLVDKDGREWVVRSVEKVPDLVVPEKLRQTFAKDLVDDATSAQFPFAALLVPPVADAVGVAHTNPVIGYAAPDKAFGQYDSIFGGKIVLVEERSPYKKSDNTIEFQQKLVADSRNTYDAAKFLKARMIDLLFADWDRHGDQWRWHATNSGTDYEPIPRDRDQVVSVTQGVIPSLVKDIYTMPRVPGFTPTIRKPRHYFFKSGFLNAHPASQLSHEEWTAIVNGFVKTVSDPVLEQSLARLPAPVYVLRHDEFLRDLKSRRDALPAAMEDYYRFINEIVDVQLSNADEVVSVQDTTGGVKLLVSRRRDGQPLVSKVYPSALTKQLRIYTMDGDDSIAVAHRNGATLVRVISFGPKKEIVAASDNKHVRFYTDTAFKPVNLYSLTFPLVNAGLNSDDGFLLGGGLRFVRQKGFRQEPYSSMYQFMLTHSFSTRAFKLFYRSEWVRVVGNTDVTLQTEINAPNNTINFFGAGNETNYIKAAGVKYYRTRFSTFDLSPALRWRFGQRSSISVGPALQYYVYDKDDNNGRFINQQSLIGTYDSGSIDKTKLHLGGKLGFVYDSRKDLLLPTSGVLVNLGLSLFAGANDNTRDYGRASAEVGIDQALNHAKTIVVSDRVGAIVSIGQPAFYQLAFLGGQGNLLGYRQFRFAGRNAFYNNFEARAKLADISSYIFPGELGVAGFFDLGRVWSTNDASDVWHNGAGGGVYYAPAQLAVIRLLAGHSTEGWYPYISLGVRF